MAVYQFVVSVLIHDFSKPFEHVVSGFHVASIFGLAPEVFFDFAYLFFRTEVFKTQR